MIVTIMIADRPDGGVDLVMREQGPKRPGGVGAQAIGQDIKRSLVKAKLMADLANPPEPGELECLTKAPPVPPVAEAAGSTEDEGPKPLKFPGVL